MEMVLHTRRQKDIRPGLENKPVFSGRATHSDWTGVPAWYEYLIVRRIGAWYRQSEESGGRGELTNSRRPELSRLHPD